jgi:hypothetical protein
LNKFTKASLLFVFKYFFSNLLVSWIIAT